MIEFKVNKKKINIYIQNNNNVEILPLIIYNSFENDGKELFKECQKILRKDYILVNISNIDWNSEMTPWKCKAIFKNEDDYLGNADKYIYELENEIIPKILDNISYKIEYIAIAGYSLGGLFALYCGYKINIFSRIISCSGSLWYPNFSKYIKENKLNKNKKIYLSLGNKEKYSKNELLSKVEDETIKVYNYFKEEGIDIYFEFNEGNHFIDVEKRLAKGIKYIVDN